jgi:thymidylate synthase
MLSRTLCHLKTAKGLNAKTVIAHAQEEQAQAEQQAQSEQAQSEQAQAEQSHDEYQYLHLIQDILNYGTMENGRNGLVKTVFGSAMHFQLNDNTIPLLTTKQVAWKTCLKELFWFIQGRTDNSLLNAQNVHIWDGNASREFLDERGLMHLAENDLGPVYGHQWRHFNAPYSTCEEDYSGKGIDQLDYIITALKNPETRNSRRLVMSAWNPCQLNEMALPPCHVLCQFNVVEGNKLSCSLYQRSGDVGLGVPFNIASYSFLTHLIANHCGLIAYEFVYYLGNAHIYDDHLLALEAQLLNKPLPFPKIKIKALKNSFEEYTMDDVEIIEYNSHGKIKMEMRK